MLMFYRKNFEKQTYHIPQLSFSTLLISTFENIENSYFILSQERPNVKTSNPNSPSPFL